MRLILPVIVLLLGAGVLLAPQLLKDQQLTITQGSEQSAQERVITEIQKREDLLLPDLKLSPPKSLYIQNKQGKRYIRFATTFSNIGPGPLELIGLNNKERAVTIARQIIQKTDGTTEEREVGAFVYHPGHDHLHWHIEKYSQFQLMHLNEKGLPGDILAQTNKLSFCIWDEHTVDLSLQNAPKTRKYSRCPRSNIQGISVGWGDTYKANVEGQELDITGILDGTYAARSIINVDRKILENDYSNNTNTTYIQISGNSLKIVSNAAGI